MNATELRIGNLIFDYECEPHYFEVEEIKKNMQGNLSVYYRDGSFMSVDPEPIPLTEGWLLRLGFTKQIGWSNVYKGEKFQRGAKSLEIASNDIGTWYAYVRNFNTREPDDFVCLRYDLMYVHELQNLYVALTGKELELKD